MAITRLGPNNSTNISGINLTSQVTGTLPTANGGTGATSFSPGKILQVVSSENAYQHSTTSSSYSDLLSASGTTWETAITPSATSSKIIIMSNLCLTWEQNGSSQNRGNVQVLSKTGSGSYSALQSAMGGNYDYGGSGVQSRQRWQIQYLISPSTTSAVTVKFQFKSSGSAATNFNDGGIADSVCILYEVAG